MEDLNFNDPDDLFGDPEEFLKQKHVDVFEDENEDRQSRQSFIQSFYSVKDDYIPQKTFTELLEEQNQLSNSMKEKKNEEKLFDNNQSKIGFLRQRQGAKKILRKSNNDFFEDIKTQSNNRSDKKKIFQFGKQKLNNIKQQKDLRENEINENTQLDEKQIQNESTKITQIGSDKQINSNDLDSDDPIQIVKIGTKSYQFRLSDPLFYAQKPVDKVQGENKCIFCEKLKDQDNENQFLHCEFCGHLACKTCCSKQRKFLSSSESRQSMQQLSGMCCKICDRKFSQKLIKKRITGSFVQQIEQFESKQILKAEQKECLSPKQFYQAHRNMSFDVDPLQQLSEPPQVNSQTINLNFKVSMEKDDANLIQEPYQVQQNHIDVTNHQNSHIMIQGNSGFDQDKDVFNKDELSKKLSQMTQIERLNFLRFSFQLGKSQINQKKIANFSQKQEIIDQFDEEQYQKLSEEKKDFLIEQLLIEAPLEQPLQRDSIMSIGTHFGGSIHIKGLGAGQDFQNIGQSKLNASNSQEFNYNNNSEQAQSNNNSRERLDSSGEQQSKIHQKMKKKLEKKKGLQSKQKRQLEADQQCCHDKKCNIF